MKTRIWNVMEEPFGDEAPEFIRASFDNEDAAKTFIDVIATAEKTASLPWRPTRYVEPGWLYSATPDLAEYRNTIYTTDEAEAIQKALTELLSQPDARSTDAQ